MLLPQKRQHTHLTSGEKAVKVSEVTASGDRNAVSSVTSRDDRGSLPLFLARHHPRTERRLNLFWHARVLGNVNSKSLAT